jgi:hypothetical protein
MNKKIVQYRKATPNQKIRKGSFPIIFPVDHPDTSSVSNTGPAKTSMVIAVDELFALNGQFETQNTIYILFKEPHAANITISQ